MTDQFDPAAAQVRKELEQLLANIPEERRPRVLDRPETPEESVANLVPDVPYAQPLRRVNNETIEVLFEGIPDTAKVQAVMNRAGHRVAVALVDPVHPEVFREIRQRALTMLTEATGWIQRVLGVAAEAKASDVRLAVGDLPIVKVGGVGWRRLSEFPAVTPEQMEQAAYWAAGRELDPKNPTNMDVDAAATFASRRGNHRLRANIYREKGNWALSLRFIPEVPIPLEQLGLPPVIETLADLERGLVLVTGPTGSGKSTTLAAIIDKINGRDAKAIQTIENPVEFIHQARKASVHQREVGSDTESFAVAMRSAMRQNPDIVLVGEIRDYEEISTAITLAETGHLVFATLHTNSAAQTVTRVIDAFPSDQQNQIRTQLSMTLKAVVCQHLFERRNESGRGVVATEVMIVNDPISALIRKGEIDKLHSFVIDGRKEGMIHMDQSLAHLVADGAIATATAKPWVTRESYFKECLQERRY